INSRLIRAGVLLASVEFVLPLPVYSRRQPCYTPRAHSSSVQKPLAFRLIVAVTLASTLPGRPPLRCVSPVRSVSTFTDPARALRCAPVRPVRRPPLLIPGTCSTAASDPGRWYGEASPVISNVRPSGWESRSTVTVTYRTSQVQLAATASAA